MDKEGSADFSAEELIEALEQCQGFIETARKLLEKKKGGKISTHKIKNRIELWGMKEWLAELRKELVAKCMRKAFHKAAVEGDNTCMFWAINKYGHHVDFLEGVDSNTESQRGWKVLLDYVKGTPQRKTDL